MSRTLMNISVWNVFLTITFCCFSPAAEAVTFDWVTVGNPGNPGETQGLNTFGAVADPYRIGKTEVTNTQYVEFLNKVAKSDPNMLWVGNPDPDRGMQITRSGPAGTYTYAIDPLLASRPARHITFFQAMRFVNWLENGQKTAPQGPGNTEDGTYASDTGTIDTGTNETRASGAKYFLPNENEWYKAAYYDPRSEAEGGPAGDDNYWLYPTKSDTLPTSEPPAGGANSANFTTTGTTDVGAYTGTTSAYDAFDMAGNLFEWTEGVLGQNRVLRGGAFDSSRLMSAASSRTLDRPDFFGSNNGSYGFRIASPGGTPPNGNGIVPEPGTLGLLVIGGIMLLLCGRRRDRR